MWGKQDRKKGRASEIIAFGYIWQQWKKWMKLVRVIIRDDAWVSPFWIKGRSFSSLVQMTVILIFGMCWSIHACFISTHCEYLYLSGYPYLWLKCRVNRAGAQQKEWCPKLPSKYLCTQETRQDATAQKNKADCIVSQQDIESKAKSGIAVQGQTLIKESDQANRVQGLSS